ncbi:MAG: hypothetical protein ACTHKK_05940 [Candidatus Nitrosocosmicus sp.]
MCIWLWIASKSIEDKEILSITLSKKKGVFVLPIERFLPIPLEDCDKYYVSTHEKHYPQACEFLKLKDHHHHFAFDKSIITECQ